MEQPVVTPEPPSETPEVKPEPPKPEPPKEEPKEFVSDKFAALARKEKAIVKARQEISAMKADMEKREASMNERMAKFEHWEKVKANAKLDPDAYLNEAGLSYGFLTERALKGEKIDSSEILSQTKAEIEAFKREQAEKEKKAQEDQKTQAQKDWEERVTAFVKDVNDYVTTNKETYELINLHNQQSLVFEVIQEASRRGQGMTVKDAAEKVESYLGDQVEKALTNSKKFKERFVAKEVKVEKPAESTPTLTNSLNTTTPVNPGFISDQERTQRALAALNKALGE